jgi:(p)ppGpp synthase/HD superfamily hydrolase
MTGYSERYEAALNLTAAAHRAQSRKGSDVPYIVHLVHVAPILLRYGYAENLVIAGLLHDSIEDQDVPLEQIESQFGPAVAEIVAALTEQKMEGGVKRPWEQRKQDLLAQLRRASHEAVAVKAADTLHNARSLASDLREYGPSIWRSFSRGPEPTLGYYTRTAALVRARLGSHPLVDELDSAIQDLAQTIAETENG